MTESVLRLKFAHPKYWLVWLGFALWWLLVKLPLRAQTAIANALGDLTWLLRTNRVRVAERNLQLCFPEWSREKLDRVLRTNMRNTVMGFFETGISWWWPTRRILRHVDFEGQEVLDELGEQGAILMGYHFTCLEIAGAVMSTRCPLDMVYRPHDNDLYDYFQRRGRTSNGNKRGDGMQPSQLLDRADLRGQVRALKQGRVLWSAFDQDAGKQKGIFVPYFGIPASTHTAFSNIARLAGVPAITLIMFRRANGRYCIQVQPPVADFPTDTPELDARRYNEIGEQLVRQNPEDYLWVHRRFKTHPQGTPDRYQGI